MGARERLKRESGGGGGGGSSLSREKGEKKGRAGEWVSGVGGGREGTERERWPEGYGVCGLKMRSTHSQKKPGWSLLGMAVLESRLIFFNANLSLTSQPVSVCLLYVRQSVACAGLRNVVGLSPSV